MKKLLAFLLVFAMIFTFAACGSTDEPVVDATDAVVPGPDAESEKPYEGVTIGVSVCNSAFMDNIAASLDEFEAATGITVLLESMQDQQLSSKVSVVCSAESGDIDVFGYRPLQETTLYVNNNWLEPLDSYIAGSGDFDYEDFFKAAREATSTSDGIFGIPYMSEREVVFLNMELLKAAGYTEGPKDMDELLEMCEALNDPENGVYALALRGEGNAAVTQFSGFMYGFGADFYDENRKATINTPEFLEAVKFYAMLCRDYCAPGTLNYGWQDTSNLFCQGSAAMRIDCDSQYAYAVNPDSSVIADYVGYSMFPANGDNGSTPFSVTAWALGINPYSQNKGAAWEFIKWATSKEMDAKGMIAGNVSSRNSTWANAEATSSYPPELLEVIVATNENPDTRPFDRPVMVEGGEARTYIGELITAAIEGKSDAELQALADDVNARVQALLDAEG